MTARRFIAACAAGLLLLIMAGCGDKPVIYKQGQYQGKPDSQPWDNTQFKSDKVEWEKAIKARNQGQDEYTRSVASVK